MKIINASRFYVEIGDSLTYNSKAVEWMNNDRKKRNKMLWPSADELNKKNPVVFKYLEKDKDSTYIQLWVCHWDIYTGLSGVVNGKRTDIWYLNGNGTCIHTCPYPLFLKVKK